MREICQRFLRESFGKTCGKFLLETVGDLREVCGRLLREVFAGDLRKVLRESFEGDFCGRFLGFFCGIGLVRASYIISVITQKLNEQILSLNLFIFHLTGGTTIFSYIKLEYNGSKTIFAGDFAGFSWSLLGNSCERFLWKFLRESFGRVFAGHLREVFC